MQKIAPMLWYSDQAEEAAKFYTSVFKNSKIVNTAYYGEGGPMPKGTVMVVEFELNGQRFLALNGGPMFKFSEAISFVINCETQAEIDYYWEKLISGGGQESQCGWLKDRFGLSWQVVPAKIGQLMSGPNAGKVMAEVMKMKKLNLAVMEKAAGS